MYWQFYDLKQNPFSLTPDPAFFFPNPHHEDALATLIDSLHRRQGIGAILGDAGLGKTLLLQVYLTLAQQRQYKTVYVAYTDLAFRTLLQMLYQALGLDFPTATLDMLLTACRQRSVILGIDEAHLVPTLTLKTHVQGVRLNHTIFASEEVIFLHGECRMDKSVLVKTAMLQSSRFQRHAESLVTTQR